MRNTEVCLSSLEIYRHLKSDLVLCFKYKINYKMWTANCHTSYSSSTDHMVGWMAMNINQLSAYS